MTLNDLITDVLDELITVAEQRDALGAALTGLSGVKTVFKRRPNALQDSQLPALLLVPGEARHDHDLYEASLRIRRNWSMWLAVCQRGQGREYEAESQAEPFVERLAIAVAALPILMLDDGRGFTMEPTGDSCVRPLDWAGTTYAAVEQRFTTIVEATVPRLDT